MTSASVSLINLSHWESGKRRIRFLYLAENHSFTIVKQTSSETQMVPLFLGADLFSNTDVRSENHSRYHAKFAKHGLAAKLIFSPEFRFQGLRLPCSKNSLWFYSVHGLFRVAFELYNRQDQLAVVESFQELLKSRTNDDNLNMTYHLTVQLNAHPQHEDHPQLVSASDSLQSSPRGLLFSTEAETNLCTKPRITNHSTSSTTDHDYCTTEHTDSKQTTLLAQRLQHMGGKVNVLTEVQLKTISSLLDFVECCIAGEVDEEKLCETVQALFQSHNPGNSIYASRLLDTVACWLGRQFSAANGSISSRVEGFKTQHIEQITNLPPPEVLATQLFPQAMHSLLTHWMGLSEEAEHWKRHSEYPILLLILEFANHNLITGVAHVLYSSLICK